MGSNTNTGTIYHPLWPYTAKPEDTVRSVLWVNGGLSTNSWKALDISGNNDITAIQIKTGNTRISIFNIYNDCTHSRALTCLRHFIQEERTNIGTSINDHILLCGDFKRHHPLWDDEADKHLFSPQALREAAVLIGMVADEGLDMALPKGIPTLKHMVSNLYSHPDNVWCSPEITPYIARCEVDSYLQPPCTDHFPIVTIIDIPQERTEPKLSFNFRMTDWESYREQLMINIQTIPLPTIIDTDEELQQAALNLTEVIQRSLKEKIPISKPCLHSKRWWNVELQGLKKWLNKLSHKAMRQRAVPHHTCHEECRKKAQEYGAAILEAKKKLDRLLGRSLSQGPLDS